VLSGCVDHMREATDNMRSKTKAMCESLKARFHRPPCDGKSVSGYDPDYGVDVADPDMDLRADVPPPPQA
jgi:hypothetical protein